MHGPAEATLALIIAALRSPASPLMAILPKAQSWKVLPRASRKGRRMRARQRANRPSPSQIAIRAHFVRARRPPNFAIPSSDCIAGGWLPSICRVGERLFKSRLEDRDVPKRRINQRLRASPPPSRLRSGRAYLTTPTHCPVRVKRERLNLSARQRD